MIFGEYKPFSGDFGATYHQCDAVTSQTVGQELGELAVPVRDVDGLVLLLLGTQLGDAVT